MLNVGSVCSGIGADAVAWGALGFKHKWFSEIEPFPRAVLQHHFPGTTLYGDFTHIRDNDHPADRGIDLLVGGTPCFPAGVRVATAEGFKPIEAVCAGDSVLTHTGRFQPVLRVGCKPATTVMVKGQGHPGVATTPEHPFYARRKSRYSTRVEGKAITVKSVSQPSWVKAEDLPGSHWACVAHWPEMPVPQVECVGRETNGVDLTPALFVLAGAYLGDGWVRINERRGYVLLGVNEAKLEKLRPYLAQVGVYQVAEMRTSCRVSLASRPLARWLSEHFGSGADGKSIPMWALGMREDLRRALLFGYQLTDGHIDKKGVGKITTVSKQLALTTRMLANSLGYASSVQFCARPATHTIEGRVVNQRDTYVVSISQSTRSSFEEQGYRWQCVRSVAPTGRNEIVYNLEVEGDNSYVVDGIAVHNCQAFSIAGLRGGLDDDRGQLALEFMRLVGALRPRWVLWENVPGVLSSNGGRDFGSILGALAELGYGFAWRVLDAQHFGVPQRRRRVFLVGHSGGDSRRAAAVLFEPEGLHGNPPSREGARQDTSGSSGDGPARCLTTGEMKRPDWETCSFGASGVVGSLAARDYKGVGSQYVDEGKCVVGFGWQEAIRFKAEKDLSGTLTKNQTQAVAFSSKDYGGDATIEQSPTLRSGSHSHSHANGGAPPAVAFSPLQGGRSMPVTPESPTDLNAVESQAFDPYNLPVTNLAATLGVNAGMSTGRNGVVQPIPLDLCNVGRDPEKKDKQNRQGLGVATPYVVRRLTPTECERLQGFPDGHTLIPWRGKSAADCPDGPRYKALGNSMAVPVMRWIGQRIEMVDKL